MIQNEKLSSVEIHLIGVNKYLKRKLSFEFLSNVCFIFQLNYQYSTRYFISFWVVFLLHYYMSFHRYLIVPNQDTTILKVQWPYEVQQLSVRMPIRIFNKYFLFCFKNL